MPAKDHARRRATWNAWYHRTRHLRVDDVPRQTAVKRARASGVEMPIAEAMADLLSGALPLGEAVMRLMSRRLTVE